MQKIDQTVLKETRFQAGIVIILSTVMQLIFVVIGKWDYTVILGNLLGGAGCVLNFFLMGLTVQNALTKEEKDAKTLMRFSQRMRLFMLFGITAIGVLLPCFNTWTVIIPLFFTRIGVYIRNFIVNKSAKN